MTVTQGELALIDAELEKVDEMCECDGYAWRVVGGDPYGGVGMSMYACDSCVGLKHKLLKRIFSDAHTVQQKGD